MGTRDMVSAHWGLQDLPPPHLPEVSSHEGSQLSGQEVASGEVHIGEKQSLPTVT